MGRGAVQVHSGVTEVAARAGGAAPKATSETDTTVIASSATVILTILCIGLYPPSGSVLLIDVAAAAGVGKRSRTRVSSP